MPTSKRPRLRDHPWLRPAKRLVRWWRRFRYLADRHSAETSSDLYPWYIEWFRHPIRIVDVAYPVAQITIPLTIGGMVWGWSWASLYVLLGGIVGHLLLVVRTVRVRQRYGVQPPSDAQVRRWKAEAQRTHHEEPR